MKVSTGSQQHVRTESWGRRMRLVHLITQARSSIVVSISQTDLAANFFDVSFTPLEETFPGTTPRSVLGPKRDFGRPLCRTATNKNHHLDYRQAKPNQVILALHWGAARHPRRPPSKRRGYYG
jgi:hypothetical protein